MWIDCGGPHSLEIWLFRYLHTLVTDIFFRFWNAFLSIEEATILNFPFFTKVKIYIYYSSMVFMGWIEWKNIHWSWVLWLASLMCTKPGEAWGRIPCSVHWSRWKVKTVISTAQTSVLGFVVVCLQCDCF